MAATCRCKPEPAEPAAASECTARTRRRKSTVLSERRTTSASILRPKSDRMRRQIAHHRTRPHPFECRSRKSRTGRLRGCASWSAAVSDDRARRECGSRPVGAGPPAPVRTTCRSIRSSACDLGRHIPFVRRFVRRLDVDADQVGRRPAPRSRSVLWPRNRYRCNRWLRELRSDPSRSERPSRASRSTAVIIFPCLP